MKFELYGPISLSFAMIVAFLALGFFFFFRTQRLIFKSHRATGVVIDLKRRHSSGRGPSFSPVVRFTALDGSEIEFVERWSHRPPRFQIGEEVLVLYNPKNFQKARVFTSNIEMYFTSWLFLGLGSVFLLVLVLIAIVSALAAFFLEGKK